MESILHLGLSSLGYVGRLHGQRVRSRGAGRDLSIHRRL
jgi:hypothetical protein